MTINVTAHIHIHNDNVDPALKLEIDTILSTLNGIKVTVDEILENQTKVVGITANVGTPTDRSP